jgi:hypothetical protein
MANRLVQITWFDRETGAAAMDGMDERIETDWTLEECRAAALYRGECEGLDLDRYDVMVEEVAPRPTTHATPIGSDLVTFDRGHEVSRRPL